MDRKKFKLRLKNIGISQKKFAILTGYGYSTVKSWDTIPQWVDIVLSYMEAFHKLQKIDKSLHMLDGLREELNVLEMNIYKKG